MKYPHPPSKRMKYMNPLKNTPLRQVSRLCFGTGMLKREKSDINLLATAFKKHGINFWDTADCYRTQKIVGAALKKVGRENIMIMTKIDAASEEAARKLIKRALSEIGTKYIDVVLLHGVESHEDFKRRKPALKVLLEHKNKGTIKAVGFSTHSSPEAVLKAPKEIDLILASINEARLDRGTREEMMAALESQKNKAIIAMKIFGGGRHVNQYKKRMDFPTKYKFIDAINIGMRNIKEVKQNAEYVYKHY